jgi:hypothetical protein
MFGMLNNDSLNDLDGFNKLEFIGYSITINNHIQLNNFCGIQTALANNFSGEYIVENNAYNPTLNELIEGFCSN